MNQPFNAAIDFSPHIRALHAHPHAVAVMRGSNSYPALTGVVRFYQTMYGVLVEVSVAGLPHSEPPCAGTFYGFHLHDGEACGSGAAGNGDPFSAALGHFNPEGCDHPHHAGDMPPLLGCKGRAYQLFLTDRLELDEVIGRTVIIHAMPDDMKTQPAGGAGERIACGLIRFVEER